MSWPKAPLRRIFRVVNGGTPTSSAAFWDGDVPWATPVDIGSVDGEYLGTTQRYLTEDGVLAGSRAVPEGSLVLSTRAPIGYVAQVSTRMAFNQGCRGLVATSPVDIRYFRYQIVSLREELVSRGAGSTFMELSSDGLASVPLSIPPIDEQRRIADFLDAETLRIDAMVCARRKQVDKLNERYSSAISELVTPGISIVVSGSRRWPWLPAHLRTTRLGHFAVVQSGVTVHGARERTTDDAEFPYLRVANVQDGQIDVSDIKTIVIPRSMARGSMLKPGDVLMTEANGNPDNLGRGAVWNGGLVNMVHQNHVFAIRLDQSAIFPEYLSALLASQHGRRYFRFTSTQVGIATTSSAKVRDFPVPVTTLAEQRVAVKEYERLRDTSRRLMDVLDCQLTYLAERRQALITAAVTGQIDVTTARRFTPSESVSA
ncbi:restriction endonuclease subunit S [Nocardia aurantia]|uniref:Type I restriction modification DNA specificity domain-containing protein n=1 Tax=Nocardia aurantia TaxID=2585199 RepID=A0A7K0DGR6_9NOCA|nr:restriction endonuclease subunit S [Nocardia aurantia]MQY24869.1 hypothetical protein [Nocardia aurantia]